MKLYESKCETLDGIIETTIRYYSSDYAKSRDSEKKTSRVRRINNFVDDVGCNLIFRGDIPDCPRCDFHYLKEYPLTDLEKITENGYISVVCPNCGLEGPFRTWPGYAIKYYKLVCASLDKNLRFKKLKAPKQSILNFESTLLFVDLSIGDYFTVPGFNFVYQKLKTNFTELSDRLNCFTSTNGTNSRICNTKTNHLVFIPFDQVVEKSYKKG